MPFTALAFIGGAMFALALPSLPSYGILLALAAAGLAATCSGGRPLAAAIAGVIAVGLQGHYALNGDWPCSRDREAVTVTGVVVSPAEAQPGRIDFELEPVGAARAGGLPRRMRLTWYEPGATPRPGEVWRLGVRLRCRNGFTNPWGFERELDLLRRGLGATGYVLADPAPQRRADSPWSAPVQRARAWAGERIADAARGTRSGAVLQGLSVGLRGTIDPALRQAFIDSGTAHLIAISGMHVTAFAIVALWLSRFGYGLLARPSLSARWPSAQAGLLLGVTGAYGLLAGASLPTVRTVVMVACALGLRAARRHATTADVLALSALLLAAADPLGITSAGFWLSFAAVAALMGLLEHDDSGWQVIRRFVRAQAAVTVVLAPVLVGAFGGVPLVGPLANAVAIPVFSLVLLPATLLGTVLLVVAPAAAGSFWQAFAMLLDECWPILEHVAGLPGAVLRPPAAPLALLVAAVAAAMAAVIVPGRQARWLATVLLAATLWRPAPAPAPGGFELVVLDVGQGLAAVVRTARRTLVFDTGPRWRGGGAAAALTLVPYLRSAGVGVVDTVIVSHPDADHTGGLGALAGAFTLRWVIGDPGDNGAADEPCVAGRHWSWDGVDFEIMHPPDGPAPAGNDASCALKIAAVGGSVLLLADPEARAEQQMLARGGIGADAVLVPHHGSRSSSTPDFVAAVGARWALVSAGYGNRWDLPHPEVAGRWRAGGAEWLATADGGALRLRVGPDRPAPRVDTRRGADPRWWRRQ